MKTAIFTSVLSLGMLVAACGKDNKNDGQTIEEIPTALAGTYNTDCTKNGVLGLSSTDRELAFSRLGDFDKKEVYYSGSECADAPSLTYKVKGTAQDKGKNPADQTLELLNFSVNDAFLTPGTEAIVTTMNASSFCGKKDWVIGQEVSIGGLDCNGFTIKKGDVIPEIYDDRDGTLFFGKSFALLLKQTGERPTQVDESIPYHKK